MKLGRPSYWTLLILLLAVDGITALLPFKIPFLGRYVVAAIVMPLLWFLGNVVIPWFMTPSESRAQRRAELADRYGQLNPVARVLAPGATATLSLILVLGVLLAIPDAQPQGHGPVAALTPPPLTFFTVAPTLPPPNVDTSELTQEEKPPALPEMTIADVALQLPVQPLPDRQEAPELEPVTLPPAAPTNLRVTQ